MTSANEKTKFEKARPEKTQSEKTKFGKTSVACGVLVDALKAKFGDDIARLEVHERKAGVAGETQSYDLWVEAADRAAFRPLLEELFAYDFVNFHVISGDDVGDDVALNYHFSLFQRTRKGRVGVSVTVRVPKSDLSMPSIHDLLPGSEYSEREIREMFGVDFVGLPNKALVFLPEDWSEEVKPWRRDSTGPSPEIVRELR